MHHGTEGLISAIASHKTTPEIISNYTKVVFKSRLDVLLGLKTQNLIDHEKSLELYKDLIIAANKFYDLVIIDLSKTTDRMSTSTILQLSDVIMYTMEQNLKQINEYIENKSTMSELAKKQIVPLIGNMNGDCKYNQKNIANYTKDKNVVSIFHNHAFLEAASEAKVANFFLNTKINKKAWDSNSQFLESVADVSREDYK